MHQSESSGRPVSHLVEFLQDIPLFSSLDPDTVGYVIERFRSFEVSAGTRLIQQGEVGDALYVVSSGHLEARDEARDIVLGEITAGEIVGEMALLTEEPRGATVRAVSNVRGYALQKADFLELLRRHPQELKRVAELVTRRAAGLEREQYRPAHHEIVDFLRTVELFSSLSDNALGELAPHLQWFTLPRGEVLLRQGDTGDQLYVVVSGRLQFDISDREGAVVRTGMIHRKDVVGELSILTEEARSATVTAVRDTGLLTLTARTVNRLMNRYPQVILGITRILALRLQAQSRTHPRAGSETIAIVPIHSSIPVREFIERFASAIAATATVRVVTRRDAPAPPGAPEITDGRGDVRFRGWLSAIEDEVDTVILVGSVDDEPWSDLCARHADRGVLLLDPQADPDPTRFELRFLGHRDGAATLPRELVFCRNGAPYLEHGRIGQFLLRRTHTRHHHVRDMSAVDIERVARFATGRAVGLALGGGGARGLAHIGAVRALREAGIPIDLVVGTSIGSLVGAVVAMELTVDEMKAAAEEYLVTDKPFQDPVFPLVSLLRGRKMSAGLQRFFGDLRVEELPLRFAAVTTDLIARDVAVLHDGPVWRAVRSSASIPGLLPPVHHEGRLLVDGGLLDNAPGDIARRLGVGKTVLFDVSGDLDHASDAYRTAYTGVSAGSAPGLKEYFRYRRRRHRSRTQRLTGDDGAVRWPGIGETLMNAMIVGSARRSREAGARADYYLRLPVEAYTMLGFDVVDDLTELGYDATAAVAQEWARTI